MYAIDVKKQTIGILATVPTTVNAAIPPTTKKIASEIAAKTPMAIRLRVYIIYVLKMKVE